MLQMLTFCGIIMLIFILYYLFTYLIFALTTVVVVQTKKF